MASKQWKDKLHKLVSDISGGEVESSLDDLEKLFISSLEFLNDWKTRDHSQPPSEEWTHRVEQTEYFLTSTLPKILKIALNKKINDEVLQQNINYALQRIIQIAVEYFRECYDLTSLFSMLIDIFDDEYNFYSTSQYSGYRDRSPEADEDGPWARAPYLSTSHYFVANLNFFGECGGFAVFLQRIESRAPADQPPFFLRSVQLFMSAISQVRKFLRISEHRPLRDWVQKIFLPLHKLMLELPDEEYKKVTRKELRFLLSGTENLLRTYFHEHEVSKAMETLQFQMALKALKNPALNKRLDGLHQINLLIEMVVRKEAQSRGKYYPSQAGGARQAPPPVTKWLDANTLAAWIHDVKLIEVLFDSRIHYQIVGRTVEIFRFLAQRKQLHPQYIDILWECTLGKGREEIQKAVYDILIDIAGDLPLAEIDKILAQTATLSPECVDAQTMKLQKHLAVYALHETGGVHPKDSEYLFGLDVVWRWIQDEGGLSIPLQTDAVVALYEVVARFPGLHRRWIRLCVDNLSRGSSVPQSLDLLQRLLETLPISGNYQSRQQVSQLALAIDNIEKEFELLDKFFADLVRFKKDVAVAIVKLGLSNDQILQMDWNVEKIASSRPYLNDLSVRMEFLYMLLRNSSNIIITQDHIDALWNCLITQSICKEERELCYRWLQEVCGNRQNCFLQPPICEYIFLEKLCRLKIDTLEDGAFSCWERYFIYVNAVGQRAKEWLDDNRILIVLHFELLGIEFLWNVVFSCKNESVVLAAMACLHSIHKNLAPSLQSRRAEFREEFIRTVMNQLSLLSQQQIQENTASVLRAISILRDFIIVMEGYPPQSQIEVNLRHNQKGGARLTLTMSATDSLMALRDRLAERISKPSCCVKLLDSQGNAFFENDLTSYTVAELELKKDSILKFDVNPIFPDSENVSASTPDLSILPSYILANTQQFFDQLWNLLSIGGEISSQIWDLISMIPTNSVLASRLTSISKDTPWNEVLDPTSSYRLEYALRIMKSIAFGTELEGNCDRDDWIVKFEQFGGVQHLFDVFFREDVEKLRAHLRPICLASLLDVLGFFLLVEIRKNPDQEEEGKPSKELRGSVLNLRASSCDGGDSQKLNFTLLTTQLLRIIETAAEITKEKADPNEGELVREASKLFFATLFSRPEYVAKLVSFPNLEGFLRKVLLESNEPIIRYVMAGGFKELVAGASHLTDEAQPFLHKFLPIVFEFIFSLPEEAPLSDSFFEMIQEIIRIGFAPRKSLSQSGSELVLSHSYCFDISEYIPIESYLDRVVTLLKAHPCIEISDESFPDEKLVGLLGIIEVFCTYMDNILEEVGSSDGKGLVEEIFFSCLFELPTPTSSSEGKPAIPPPKCKTQKSRTYALRALQSLARGPNKTLFELLNSIKECHLNSKGVDCSSPWGHNPAVDLRSKIGYAGIKNLGCICYMISLLQQFYMIPYFRRGIFSIDFDEIEKKKAEPSNLDEHVIYQLQVMFSYLKETQKQYYNPRPFTNSFKDGNGNVMDVSVQMDVDEFFNILCDKLETYLKGSPQASLLKSLFNGKEAMQLIGHCGHRKENECDFNVMTLTIKGKNSVLEALSSFVQGDLLDGDNAYFCDGCNKKVDTLKRTCIKILPNVLLLHLKRFDFDFDTMRNEKVNDYCEFPLDLDMEPYTREGLAKKEKEKKNSDSANVVDSSNPEGEEEGESSSPKQEEGLDLPIFPREYYEYELRGVLVHRGVADSGHYYSFIKERGGSGRWIEFNDDTVRLFDPSNLGSECFGGQETITQYNEQTKQNVRKSVPITRNAYMLIYERKVSKPFQILDSKGEPVEIQHGILDPSVCDGERVPPSLYELVWKHNIRHQQDVWVFDKAYLDTLTYLEHQLLEGGIDKRSSEEQLDLIQLFGRLFIEIVSHSQEKELITQFAAFFLNLMGTNSMASKWLLKTFVETKFEGKTLLLLMLLHCHVEETREACAALLIRSFRIAFAEEQEAFLEKCDEDYFESDATFRHPYRDEESAPLTLIFLRELLKEFKFMPYNWRTFSDYFLVLREIALAEQCVRSYFLKIRFLSRLFDLFLGEDSPNAKKNTRKMGDKYAQPNFTHLLSLISILVCSLQVQDPSPLALPILGDFPMTVDVMELVDSTAFMKRLADQKNIDDVARMYTHLCFQRKEYSGAKIKWIHEGIHGSEHDGMRPYFCILLPILDLEDGLQSYRVSYFMGKIGKTIEHFKKYPMFTKTCIEYTYSMRSNPAILKYMNDNIREWEDHLGWAREKTQTTSSFTREPDHLSLWAPYSGTEVHFSQKLWEFGDEHKE